MRPHLVVALWFFLVCGFSAPREAGATLVSDAARLSEVLGAPPRRTVFLEEGRRIAADLRLSTFNPGESKPGPSPGASCTTVIALGAVGHAFRLGWADRTADDAAFFGALRTGRTSGRSEEGWEMDLSVRGVAVLSRCDDVPESFVLQMDSARGAVELWVLVGEGVSREHVLEELGRTPSVNVEPLAPLMPAPFALRRRRAEAFAKREGASTVTDTTFLSNEEGKGEAEMRLPIGCHRVQLLADAAGVAFDLDAEIIDADTQAPLGRDQSEVSDARLEFCLGRTTSVLGRWVGAPPRSSVHWVNSHFPGPSGLEPDDGPRAYAAMAKALWRRGGEALRQPPIFRTVGAQGRTKTGLAVDPDGCYLVAVGPIRGATRGLSLAARAGSRSVHDDAAGEGAAVGLCAAGAERLGVTVDSPAISASWALYVWELPR